MVTPTPWYENSRGGTSALGSAAITAGSSLLGHFAGRSDRKRAAAAQRESAAAMREANAISQKRLDYEIKARDASIAEAKRQQEGRLADVTATGELSGNSTARLGEVASTIGQQYDTAAQSQQRQSLGMGIDPTKLARSGYHNVSGQALGKAAAITRERTRGAKEGADIRNKARSYVATGDVNYGNALSNTTGVGSAYGGMATSQRAIGQGYGQDANRYSRDAQATQNAIAGLGQRFESRYNQDAYDKNAYEQANIRNANESTRNTLLEKAIINMAGANVNKEDA